VSAENSRVSQFNSIVQNSPLGIVSDLATARAGLAINPLNAYNTTSLTTYANNVLSVLNVYGDDGQPNLYTSPLQILGTSVIKQTTYGAELQQYVSDVLLGSGVM
jgi:hypothetical protein